MRANYEEGVRVLHEGSARPTSHDGAGGNFRAIYDEFTPDGLHDPIGPVPPVSDEFLYERLDDGHWAYRCDELTRLFALALYRWGLWDVDREPRSLNLCLALQVRPDVVLDVARNDKMSARARATFEAAAGDRRCVIEGGWRTPDAMDLPPVY